MKKILLIIAILISSNTFAGNGVERGSVMIKGTGTIQDEIVNYLAINLSKCQNGNKGDYFLIKNQNIRKNKIDQGIIDLYYELELTHHNYKNEKINELKIEILDSDFHNWKQYEEKLSFELIIDKNNQCS